MLKIILTKNRGSPMLNIIDGKREGSMMHMKEKEIVLFTENRNNEKSAFMPGLNIWDNSARLLSFYYRKNPHERKKKAVKT
jgi:hypothetical protein